MVGHRSMVSCVLGIPLVDTKVSQRRILNALDEAATKKRPLFLKPLLSETSEPSSSPFIPPVLEQPPVSFLIATRLRNPLYPAATPPSQVDRSFGPKLSVTDSRDGTIPTVYAIRSKELLASAFYTTDSRNAPSATVKASRSSRLAKSSFPTTDPGNVPSSTVNTCRRTKVARSAL